MCRYRKPPPRVPERTGLVAEVGRKLGGGVCNREAFTQGKLGKGGRSTGSGCAAYSSYTVRGARAYDPLSQLYNTDFYFRDFVTHQTG